MRDSGNFFSRTVEGSSESAVQHPTSSGKLLMFEADG